MKKLILICFALLAVGLAFATSTPGLALAAFPFAGNKSVGDLERFANRYLSSYDGDDDRYEGYDGDELNFVGGNNLYTGEGDHMLDFGGPNRSFMNVNEDAREFTMSFINANIAIRTVLLTPGIVANAVGTAVDGAFNDTTGAIGLTGFGSPKTIAEFLAFVYNNPTSINGMRITSTVPTAQMAQMMTVRQSSPFRDLESRIINYGANIGQDTFRDSAVRFNVNLILSNQTQLILPIAGSSTCTVTFFAGAILNQASALEQKKSLASASVAKVGSVRPFVQSHNVRKGAATQVLAGRIR